MKLRPFLTLLPIIIIAFTSTHSYAQLKQNPWTAKQLMNPAELARIIKTEAKKPMIFCIGPVNYIPGAVFIGSLTEGKNAETFKKKLEKLPKNTSIVVYCGCCPFEHCPNIRPAMNILNHMKFTNQKLLNLPQNIKVDWIDKGYPTK